MLQIHLYILFFIIQYPMEIIIRTIKNFTTHKEILQFMEMAADNKVQVISLCVKQDDDNEDFSGKVFYKSDIAPMASGFDILQEIIKQAHKRDIQVKAWIPQFHDQVAFKKNQDWRMMFLDNKEIIPYTGASPHKIEYFVNPLHSEVQFYERLIIKQVVSNYDIDGVMLDWIRFDNYKMDLSNFSRNQFLKVYGYDPITIDFDSENKQRNQWQQWRTSKLAQYFKDVRDDVKAIKPNLKLGVFIMPPTFKQCGQDVSKFSEYVDIISPMAYFKDWKYPVKWVYSQCLKETVKKVNEKKLIPVLGSNHKDQQYEIINKNVRKMYPDLPRFCYFAYGKWTFKKLYPASNYLLDALFENL